MTHLRGHLQLHEARLPAAEEWVPAGGGWNFVHIHSGQGYWLGQPNVHELEAGDMLVIPAREPGALRVSRVGPIHLFHFGFAPELLTGFLTLAERQQFEEAAAQ